jgi:hypothetical protein
MATKSRIKAKGKKRSTMVTPKAEATPRTEGPKPARSRRSRAGTAEAPARPAKHSALEAAVRLLGETGQAMNCQEMIAAMVAKGYWTSPGGKTPSATLYTSILKELTTKGAESRFVKVDRGRFALRNARA